MQGDIQMSVSVAMAFQVSKTRHNSRTKLYFANPQIAYQENMTRSLFKLLKLLLATSLILEQLK